MSLKFKLIIAALASAIVLTVAHADIWMHTELWKSTGGDIQVRHTYFDPLGSEIFYEFEWAAPAQFVDGAKCRNSAHCTSITIPCAGVNNGTTCVRCRNASGGGLNEMWCSPDSASSQCRKDNAGGGSAVVACGVQEPGTCNGVGECVGTIGIIACDVTRCTQG